VAKNFAGETGENLGSFFLSFFLSFPFAGETGEKIDRFATTHSHHFAL
jgi:hypothetical protein